MDQNFIDRLRSRGLVSSEAAANLMTHYAEQPNPAQPYIDAATGFARGGLQGAGAPMPDWMMSNPVQRALQNPDNQLALEAFSPLRDPVKAARINELLAQGLSQEAIAREMNVGKAAIYRHLNRTERKTLNPASGPDFMNNPDEIAQYQKWAKEGRSQSYMAKQLDRNIGTVSKQLSRLNEAGLIKYQPEWGAVPVSKPSLPQIRLQQAPAPESDPSTERAIIDYLRSKGLHAEADQLSQSA